MADISKLWLSPSFTPCLWKLYERYDCRRNERTTRPAVWLDRSRIDLSVFVHLLPSSFAWCTFRFAVSFTLCQAQQCDAKSERSKTACFSCYAGVRCPDVPLLRFQVRFVPGKTNIVCSHARTHAHACAYIHIHVHIYVCTYVRVHTCTHVTDDRQRGLKM